MTGKLTLLEQEVLRSEHRREKNGRDRDRIKAILLSDKGWTYKMIAEALLLDEETIYRYVRDYSERKKTKLESGGYEGKLTSEQSIELVCHLEQRTYVKVGDICSYVEHTYKVRYTISGMTSWLRQHKFSYKKPKGEPVKADPLKQEAFKEFYTKLQLSRPDDEPILFADGVHPTMATKISYGWIRTGKDKVIGTTASRTRINIMGAINLEEMSITVAEYPTINSEAMVEYLELIKSRYPKAPKIHFILDQGPYNISALTKEAAKRLGIILHYLPPYSPNLNPVERLWKVMNEYARNNKIFSEVKQFRSAIMSFFNITWPDIAMSMVDRINDNFQTLQSSI